VSRQKQRAEAEIGALRQAWEEESARMERERKEQDENLKKQRQRAIEDYEYKKALERKKDQDKYEEEMRLVEKKTRSVRRPWRKRGDSARRN
jgi:colicin import membrane protein